MSSISGLPTKGSDVIIVITKVHLHPLSVLVEFWGKFGQQRVADYEHLSKNIQSPGVAFKDLEGNPGDQCLVQIEDTWYRARIVSRNGSKYSVFLFDKGIKCNTTTSKLAWGKREHFQLPPEVEFCVLSNLLSLIPENGWSPMALEFLRSLTGKSVTAHVEDVLMPHQMFLLHIPSISNQMYEMGLAKKVSPLEFQDFVFKSLKSHSGGDIFPKITQLSMETSEQLHKKELFMYPELPEGTAETVIVTELANPQRIFCQLKVFSRELKKLTQQITQSCENRIFSCIISPDMIGFPCAAKGSNGKWYRSVLQQVFPANKVVEVLNVDYGTKQLVPLENVRPLASEFFRLPVVTYICSLHGIIDKGVGWTTTQIDFLRSLLLFKTVIAKFEYQSISEGVYYVTLYSDDNTNINNLFGSNEGCLLKQENTYVDYAIQNSAYSCQHASLEERNVKMSGKSLEEKGATETLTSEELSVNSSHLAVIEHISSPSEFWIQTQKYRKELDQLQDSIYQLYQDSVNTHVLRNPSLGFFCAAKADDGDFYRATVTEVRATQVKVFFVDYGNSRVADRSDIRTLPPEFKNLPKLALKCSLANVKPKEEKWSQSATELFIKEVRDKVLNVHVKAKHNDSYVVKLTDPKAQGKQDISTLLCSAGFAEKADMQKHPKVKSATQTGVMSTTPEVAGRVPGLHKNVGSFQTQSKVDLSCNEGGAATFKEQMFPTGSLLDVSVSYIESPSDFWCQLAQNAWHLRLLMNDLQTYYAGSEFQPDVKTACVARHPDNGMWYRALVVRQHETPHVEVLFVDYGQTEMVSLYDLRRICPEFLALHGQAFRCSLFNLTDSTSAANEWNEEAKAKFQNFVETAASNFVILKCTIYAVMYSESKILYNIVDLATPFESICTSLARLVTTLPTMKTTGASLRLNSYYYSTHNVKTGTEEKVTVTCVNSVGQFYCHLDRNADTMKDLNTKVNKLCHHLEKMKLPSVFGTLCFARYTDGQWYRAQIKTTRPAVLVQFVDYGDTIKVDKAHLLPVPKEANEIMSVPVQAVACSLADMPANVPSEVNNWFEMAVKECEFRALVVAREPDGKLLVELYHGNTQINAKIKKMFQIEMQREERVVNQSREAFEDSANNNQKTPKQEAVDIKKKNQTPKKDNLCSSEPPCQITLDKAFTDVSHQSSQKHVRPAYESGRKIKHPPLEPYVPPHQRRLCGTVPNTGFVSANIQVSPKKESPLPETKLLKSSGPESKRQNKAEKLPKLTDLPANSITPGTAADVYISHCSSPFSFYVQRVDEEDEMLSLVEKLNDPESALQAIDIKDLHLGDLVQAEFSDDSSWYRAVVKEIHANAMALVEFVDFGNTAITPISKMGRLQTSVLQLPVYSTHCMLNDAAVLGEEKVWDPAVVSAFKNNIDSIGEKVLKCQFIRQVGSVWEVRLEDGGVDVVCKVYSGSPEVITEKQLEEEKVQMCGIRQEAEESLLDSSSVRYHQQQELLDGQQLEVYVTVINDAQTFWCQSANSEELDRITGSVSEAAVETDGMHIDPDDLFPGRPCIALFSDDQLWYRAEVISKDGNDLSVLFVDYGNASHVRVTDVREIPPLLADIAPQAFLCHLEGFDASCGSWDSGAADQLSLLTADKLLQLTVTRVTRAEVKVQRFVRMAHEGQVINEAMKAWWKCFTEESTPDSVGPTLKLDLTEEQECQQEHHDKHDLYSSHIWIHPESNDIEKLADPLAAGDASRLASIPKTESSEVSVSFESCVEASKKEHVSVEGMNLDPASVTTPEDILPNDVGKNQTTLPSVDDKGDRDILGFACNMTEDIDKGAENGPEPDSLLEENVVEEMHEPDTETADKEEAITSICDIKDFSDPSGEKADIEVTVAKHSSQTCMAAVKMDSDAEALTCCVAKTLSTDICAEELSVDGKVTGAKDDCVSIVTAEETTTCIPKTLHMSNGNVGPEVNEDLFETLAEELDEGDAGPEVNEDLCEESDEFAQGVAGLEVKGLLELLAEESDEFAHLDVHPEVREDACDASAEEPDEFSQGDAGPEINEDIFETSVEESVEGNAVPEVNEDLCEESEEFALGVAGPEVNEDLFETQAEEPDEENAGPEVHEDVFKALAEAADEFSQGDAGPEINEDLFETLVEESVEGDAVPEVNADLCQDSDEIQNESVGPLSRTAVETGEISLQDDTSSTSIHEEDNVTTEDDTSSLPEQELYATSDNTEMQTGTELGSLLEKMTCLVGEACSAEICPGITDSQQEKVTDESEQQACTPQQNEDNEEKDLVDNVLSEEMWSTAEDSSDAQLSETTRLTDKDVTSHVPPVGQQPEE